mmetsp:Transcript_55759/g.174741  ORF Transcript_55759/g.174741 Transcript_55759/m.174741 type:complete len:200 (+) Transcript_55759:246-845(+)
MTYVLKRCGLDASTHRASACLRLLANSNRAAGTKASASGCCSRTSATMRSRAPQRLQRPLLALLPPSEPQPASPGPSGCSHPELAAAVEASSWSKSRQATNHSSFSIRKAATESTCERCRPLARGKARRNAKTVRRSSGASTGAARWTSRKARKAARHRSRSSTGSASGGPARRQARIWSTASRAIWARLAGTPAPHHA